MAKKNTGPVRDANSPTRAVAGLFAGVGGIELGFKQAGFDIVFANDNNVKASMTYTANHPHPLLVRDVELVKGKELPEVNIITGGFPCQPFSVAGYRKGFDDSRGNLFLEIIRLLEEKKPEVVFLENVKNLVGHDDGHTFKVILESLAMVGYRVKYKVLNANQFGVPQNRERIYIVGFRDKDAYDRFQFPEGSKKKASLSKFIDFENKVDEKYYYREDKAMYPQLKEAMTSSDTVYQWRRTYVRENKNNECPTITQNAGAGGHNVGLILTKHGIRKLTPRECFNLMGFPKSFKLPSNVADSHYFKQAGNSVVVPVIKAIADQILLAMEPVKVE